MSMNAETSLEELLAQIFRVFSTPERVRALELIKEGKSLEETAKLIGMSRTGFQRVLNDFQSLELIEPTGHRSYRKLSFKGAKILELFEEIGEKIKNIETEDRENKFWSLAERSLPAPALDKLKEAWDSIKAEKIDSSEPLQRKREEVRP